MKKKTMDPKKIRVDEFIRRDGLDRLVSKTNCSVSRHSAYPNLVLLKYDQRNSPMGSHLAQQCRGIILDEADDWGIVSYPYNKFFNHGEQHAAKIDWGSARVYEKLDGSLCTLYYYDNKWNVATSGSPDAAGPVDLHKITFAELFWKAWEEMGYRLPDNTQLCYMFELMTPENRIVVPHKERRLVLHGARWVIPKMQYAEVRPEPIAEENGWECVKTYPLRDINGVLAMADSINGLESEGFVVCDRWFNRLKIKAKSYVDLHYLKSSLSRKRLMEIVQANEGSEFLRYFPEYRDVFWDLKDRFRITCDKAEDFYAQHKDIESQKDFALAVKDSEFAPACFATRAGKVTDPTTWFMNQEPKKVLRLIGACDD